MKKISKAVSHMLSMLFILPIKLYRRLISPMFPACCKYYPTCSGYAVDAYKKHGVFMGSLLTVWRLLRCNPWSLGGVDHVPEVITPGYFVPKNVGKKKEK